MVSNLQAKGVNENSVHLYKESANTLFNFMGEYQYLTKALENMELMPRYNIESVEYLHLNSNGTPLKRVAIPMLCFCDIFLHKIEPHYDTYGFFGIGISKKLAQSIPIQPITYLNPISPLTKDLGNGLNGILGGSKVGQVGDSLLTELKFLKPIYGKGKIKDQNFHDEHEWRFIPKIDIKVADPILLDTIAADVQFMNTKRSLDELSNLLGTHEEFGIKLQISDINYLFVKDADYVRKLLKWIADSKFDSMEKLDLASKVINLQTLKGDW
ncbi:MAG: abortive infection system antitoxin AbiGi family protein [Lentilactobacillus hilgardii]|uniref:abortive infection system antitoxin AbiGi family protein n=1 Tax=Lactobacillaceae TaxID=33958 RepID=UPI001CC20E59|nr:abortive infection system antitoxin AbiGi family protein [Lentilactobacillus hilgardii]MBZ2200235.1 hypothetical protein [Lentilactobacillus hilgardii]MBZ2203359.1 hypothetical protein [Lentilactobacillus hilgardii]